MRKLFYSTAAILLSASSALSDGAEWLDARDNAERKSRLLALAPDIVKGLEDFGHRIRLCNYFHRIYEGQNAFEAMGGATPGRYVNYLQCCPNTIGLPQAGVLTKALGSEDPLPTLPELRRRHIKQTEAILHVLVQDHDFTPLMNALGEQIRQATNEHDRVSCTPLSATYEIMQSPPGR